MAYQIQTRTCQVRHLPACSELSWYASEYTEERADTVLKVS